MIIRVVACVIEREGRLLVCERPPHKRHGGLWEFPGGKVEPGETELEAARRELGEELELEVEHVGPVEFSMIDPGSRYRIEFLRTAASGVPRAVEHSRIEWVPLHRLLTLPLAPSDLAYARHLVGGGAAVGGGVAEDPGRG